MIYNPTLFAKLESGEGYNKTREESITNPYVNFFNHANTQSLQDTLVAESIQMRGVECYYIRREYVNLDLVFGEDPSSSFKKAYKIATYIQSFDSYEGQRDFFSKFGMQVNDEITFQVNPSLFKLQSDGKLPMEGDLIYFPMGNALFELTWVENKQPFYQTGTNSIITITASKFIYSGEKLDAKVKTKVESEDDFGLDLSELTTFEPSYTYEEDLVLAPVNNLDGVVDIKKAEYAEDRQMRVEASEFVDKSNFQPVNASPLPNPLTPPSGFNPFDDF